MITITGLEITAGKKLTFDVNISETNILEAAEKLGLIRAAQAKAIRWIANRFGAGDDSGYINEQADLVESGEIKIS